MNEELLISREEGCWTLTINRPHKMNAFSDDLVESLLSAVDAAPRSGAKLIVFQGSGKNFSAGFDFGNIDDQTNAELLRRFVRIEMLLQSVAGSPCATMALAHGRNFGAGVDLFAVCRERICAPGSTFGMPGLQFGLVLGTRRFASIVGADTAVDILGSARTVNSDEAVRIGLVREEIIADAWPGAVSAAAAIASRQTNASREMMVNAIDIDRNDTDLANLVRSAAIPGLKDRIKKFREID